MLKIPYDMKSFCQKNKGNNLMSATICNSNVISVKYFMFMKTDLLILICH